MPLSVQSEEVNFSSVEQVISLAEKHLSAYIGVSILDTATNQQWDYKGDERVPLTSTFKTLACAKLLFDVDQERILPSNSVVIVENDLVTYSPVTEKYVGKTMTLYEACSATMLTSDNTAANKVLEVIGGPSEVTKFVGEVGDDITRLDRFETELNEGKPGDLRDTTTPNTMSHTLKSLLFGSVLSEESRAQLMEWMVDNQVTGNLLRPVLPQGWKIGDRSGAGGYGSRSITAVVWSENRAPLIISIYIAQTEASFDDRNQAITRIGKAIFTVLEDTH
ncbi:beta-lactamase [Litoribrevibacter albus]|uniref:beta-lactamase n=2 Tax=Litoribrevibacter albus TaxID=1473156 RepID=A0AA37W802_9GAMM|nr:beta-lactamase [Litoribrevibacter albus]